MTKTIKIEGMSCAHCAARVRNALDALPGVSSSVDLASKTATVTSDSPVADAALEEAVTAAGYTVVK
jgi:Cu+-exporting ATPase